MGCLINPLMKLHRLSSSHSRRFAYQSLTENVEDTNVIKVVVGKEKKEFMVEPYVLEEKAFRVLIGSGRVCVMNRTTRVVWLDHVDSILFEHLLWLLRNDVSTFSDLGVVEIIEFYAQDC